MQNELQLQKRCFDWNSLSLKCRRLPQPLPQGNWTFQPKPEWSFLRVGLHTWIVQAAQAKPLNKSMASWSKGDSGEVASHPSIPFHHGELVIHSDTELKNPPGTLSILVIVQSQTQPKQAVGGGLINICNGKSRTKGQITLCTQCSFCNRTGWLWGRGCRYQITLTLNAGSVWGSSTHSLPLRKDTNAQQLHRKDCSEFLSRKKSMEELLGKVVNFNLAWIRMLT